MTNQSTTFDGEANPDAVGHNNYVRVARWLERAGKPRNGLTMGVQAGCMVEEVVEFFETWTLSSASGVSSILLSEARRLLTEVATQLKSGQSLLYIYDREAAIDAMADIDVTVNGIAYLGGFDKESADNRVIDSLFDKFNPDGTPVILPGGKIGKREGWVAPDLSDCAGELGGLDDSEQPFDPETATPQRWAQEFLKSTKGREIDESVLTKWFADTLLTGMETAKMVAAAQAPSTSHPAELPLTAQAVQSINAEGDISMHSISGVTHSRGD